MAAASRENNNSLLNTAAFLRVPKPLLKTNPEAYIPQFISFGPYHNSTLEKDIDSPSAENNITTAEALKGKYADRLSQILATCGKSFESVVEMMKRMRPEIESFYHCPTWTEYKNCENFARMMAIDSSFLLQILFENQMVRENQMVSLCTFYSDCISYDMIKMENQIPLFVLKEIFEYAKVALPLQDFNELLKGSRYTPFPGLVIGGDEITREPHYLGYAHASHSILLETQAGGGEDQAEFSANPILLQLNGIREKLAKWIGRFVGGLESVSVSGLFPNGISAVQLDRAGIKFKPFPNRTDKIRLDKIRLDKIRLDIISGTVYLPLIVVCDVRTEVFLRNMLALEFNDALRPKYVTSYVALMGILVQSPEDVRMLVDRHIISRGRITLTDEGMVKLWNDVRQSFLRVGVTAVEDEFLSALKNWCEQHYWIHLKIKVRRKVSGLIDYMSSWRFIAPLAGFLGLAMTAIQTYCSVYH